jgi:hypothetical protein
MQDACRGKIAEKGGAAVPAFPTERSKRRRNELRNYVQGFTIGSSHLC